MSRYQLSEAYSEIYDYRKIEESFDNLRFVDYMLPEHIEEVIEEMVWEFRDYGHTLEESFEMIDYALEDEVICESYDQLVADVLYEARRVDMASRIASRKQYAAQSEASATEARQRAKRQERGARVRGAARTVRNKLTGPISSVKQAVAGSAGGMGKSVKALGGKVVDRGKALLKGLLRRGGKSLSKTGKQMMTSGTKAAAAPATTRTARVGGRQVTVTTEPTAETGSKRRAVGSAIRKVGKSLKRMGKDKKAPTVTSSTSEPTPESTPARPVQTGPVRASIGRVQPGPASRSAETLKRPPMAPATPKEPASRLKPNVPGRKERASSGGIKSSSATVSPQKQGPSQLGLLPPKGATTRTPSGNIRADSQRTLALARAKKAGRTALEKSRQTSARKQRVMAEDFDVLFNHLVEDLINAGYTSTVEESFDLINTIDENALTEIMSEYLLD